MLKLKKKCGGVGGIFMYELKLITCSFPVATDATLLRPYGTVWEWNIGLLPTLRC
jgi:hypothetical protein